jgi:hypothetical protein
MEKIKAQFAAIGKSIRGNRTWTAVLVLVLLWVLDSVTSNFVTGTVLPYLWERFNRLLEEPVGLFGSIAIGLIAFIALAGIIEQSPMMSRLLERIGKPKPAPPPSLTSEDRELIQHIRTLWELQGQSAVGTLYNMYDLIIGKVRKQYYWSPLLNSSREELRQSMSEVDTALGHDSTIGIAEVRERFNKMLAAYFEAIRWIAQMEGHGDVDCEEEHLQKIRYAWSLYHYGFRQELNKLATIPGHRGTLTSKLDFSEDRFLVKFVEDAEKGPEARPPAA